MSKYLYRFLIAIILIALGGLTYTASGQCMYAPSAPLTDEVVLEQDDFSVLVDGSLQPITAPTVPGTCLAVVGAIREGILTDTGVSNPLMDMDIDTYRLELSAPATFTLRLEYNEDNFFQLIVADPTTGLSIQTCPPELTAACIVQLSSSVNLNITGNYAGVYILSIINGVY